MRASRVFFDLGFPSHVIPSAPFQLQLPATSPRLGAGQSSSQGNDRADALVQWGKKSRAYARLRERKEGEQEDIDIIKEGHIASDGNYGRLAIEEYEKEKREKRKERDRESTAKRSQRTGHPTAAKPRFSGDQLGQSTATAGE